MKNLSTEKPLPEIKFFGRTVRSERGISLIVVLMLMVIILAIVGAGLFFSGIDLRVSGNYRAGTQAFYAADTGASFGFSRIQSSVALSTASFGPTPANGGFYCSGTIASTASCTAGQQLPAPTTLPAQEATLSSGAVYNSDRAGFFTYQYQIDATGAGGPLGAARQVQALATFGPVQ
jgi:Tfp pilus assembly protein PilX